jgi:hypothetical protein
MQAFGDRAPLYSFLCVDLLTALGLAWVMLRNPEKLWPGVAACAQILVVVLSATRAIDYPLSERAYLIALGLCSMLGMGSLAIGAAVSRWGGCKPDPWLEAERRLIAA